ncbi:hypothetical protein [Streptomyces sp. NPDC020489]|uniref:hypothetical protein n=1 Tax=Streptomyces sp. NPDC020489 TaxID=3365077 RepID=UPI00379CCE66
MPTPTTHARTAELTSQAWAEARSMAGTAPDHAPRPSGRLAAAALRTHSTLSASLGHSVPVPFTALGPAGGGTVRQLAAFLAVYADQDRP